MVPIREDTTFFQCFCQKYNRHLIKPFSKDGRHPKMPSLNEEEAAIHKVLKRRLVEIGKNKRLEYLVAFKNKSIDHNGWVATENISNAEGSTPT